MTKNPWFTLDDRTTIERMYNEGARVEKIAKALGRNRATVYRELNKGFTGEMDKNGRPGYRADLGQKYAYERRVSRMQQA